MTPEQKSDVLTEAVKAAPPIAITTAAVGGLTLNEWVALATLLYIVLQSGWLVWKWYHAIKDKKNEKSPADS